MTNRSIIVYGAPEEVKTRYSQQMRQYLQLQTVVYVWQDEHMIDVPSKGALILTNVEVTNPDYENFTQLSYASVISSMERAGYEGLRA